MPAERWRSKRPIAAAALLAAVVAGCAMRGVVRPSRPAAGTALGSGMRRAVLVEMAEEDRKAYEEGLALAAELRYAEALEKFTRVVEWYRATGDDPRAAEALFWQGYCFEKTGRPGAARRCYEQVARRYPGTEAAQLALRRLGRLPAATTRPAPRSDVDAPPPRGDRQAPAGRRGAGAVQGASPAGRAAGFTAGRLRKGL